MSKAAPDLPPPPPQQLEVYQHGTLILKHHGGFLHNRCHDTVIAGAYPSMCCNYFTTFPGGEDVKRFHCNGHVLFPGEPITRSSCGCHGGHRTRRLQELSLQELEKLTSQDKARCGLLRPPTSSSVASHSGGIPPSTSSGETACCICFERPRDCCFRPCSHVRCCEPCAEKVSECPVCRAPITERFKVHL